MREEQFLSDGPQVEALTDRTRLPPECSPHNGGCKLARKTYIWDVPREQCHLEKVRTTKMMEEDGYLVDYSNKILWK